MSLPTPTDDRRCTAMNRQGKRCKAWTLTGEPTCQAHTSGRGTIVMTDPAAAQARSIAKQKQKREDAEQAAYVRTLGYKEQLRHRLAAKASKVADVIEGMLDDPDPTVRLRAAQEWANRVYGRPHTTSVVVEAPVENPLADAFAALSPEERRALLRLAQPQLEAGGDA